MLLGRLFRVAELRIYTYDVRLGLLIKSSLVNKRSPWLGIWHGYLLWSRIKILATTSRLWSILTIELPSCVKSIGWGAILLITMILTHHFAASVFYKLQLSCLILPSWYRRIESWNWNYFLVLQRRSIIWIHYCNVLGIL